MNAQLKHAAPALAILLLSGCALLGRRDGAVLFAPTLSDAGMPAAAAGARVWQIEVIEPQAAAPLLGTRILVAPQPGHIEVYPGVRWHDAPPTILQAMIVQAMHDQGVAGAAGSASVQRADFLLESELLRMQAEYRDAKIPVASVRLDLRLLRVSDGQVIAAHAFMIDEPAQSSAIDQVTAAFQRALDRLVREVAAWTVAAADHAYRPQSPDL